jgi:hypothetical protein
MAIFANPRRFFQMSWYRSPLRLVTSLAAREDHDEVSTLHEFAGVGPCPGHRTAGGHQLADSRDPEVGVVGKRAWHDFPLTQLGVQQQEIKDSVERVICDKECAALRHLLDSVELGLDELAEGCQDLDDRGDGVGRGLVRNVVPGV